MSAGCGSGCCSNSGDRSWLRIRLRLALLWLLLLQLLLLLLWKLLLLLLNRRDSWLTGRNFGGVAQNSVDGDVLHGRKGSLGKNSSSFLALGHNRASVRGHGECLCVNNPVGTWGNSRVDRREMVVGRVRGCFPAPNSKFAVSCLRMAVVCCSQFLSFHSRITVQLSSVVAMVIRCEARQSSLGVRA